MTIQNMPLILILFDSQFFFYVSYMQFSYTIIIYSGQEANKW